MTGVDLARRIDRLVDQVSHWTPPRWAASTPSGASRAEVAYALAQRLADLEAEATGRGLIPVPQLGSDLALPDQWRVVARDLLAAQPETRILREACEAVAEARAELLPVA
ncbi:MAG: hypothetical protein J2P15_15185 [Micromonosporaceae bacterium]|nr:hypothetical protein [Micromonosporaceae bacterium]